MDKSKKIKNITSAGEALSLVREDVCSMFDVAHIKGIYRNKSKSNWVVVDDWVTYTVNDRGDDVED